MPRKPAESHFQNFRTKAGASHSEQQCVPESGLNHIAGGIPELLQVSDLIFSHVKPAEPFMFFVACPQRAIAFPQAVDFVIGLPVFECGVDRLLQRRWQVTAKALNFWLYFCRFSFFLFDR